MSPDSAKQQLPVHGFVLAGGRSSRMGRDKAALPFRGRPMVEIAVLKLRSFCTAVSIAGNREDLRELAPIATEARDQQGPAAGIEAALAVATERWMLAVPVDVPLVPAPLLRAWAEAVLRRERADVRASFLRAGGVRQPAFCMLHTSCAARWTELLERGDRKLGMLYEGLAAGFRAEALWIADAEQFAPDTQLHGGAIAATFSNVNTPEDLAALERSAAETGLK